MLGIYIVFKDQLGFLKTMLWTQLIAKMRAHQPVKNKSFGCSYCRRCFEKIETQRHINTKGKFSRLGASIEDFSKQLNVKCAGVSNLNLRWYGK